MLLSLPREIRDMIIDNVLLTPYQASPVPSEIPSYITPFEVFAKSKNPPTTPFAVGLLEICDQLRAETSDHLSEFDLPLVLDVIGLENGSFQCTWLRGPFSSLLKSGRISLSKIQVRLQPVDVRFRPAGVSGFSRCHYMDSVSTISRNLMVTIRQSIISIIRGGARPSADPGFALIVPHHPNWCQGTRELPNTVAHVQIEITAALSEADEAMSTSSELEQNYREISCQVLSNRILERLRDRYDFFLGRGSYDPTCLLMCPLHGRPPILTHVGTLSAHWDDVASDGSKRQNSLRFEGHDADINGISVLTSEFKRDIKKTRREIGWEETKSSGKKRKRGKRRGMNHGIIATYSAMRREGRTGTVRRSREAPDLATL
jgi:hypothetical protein